MGDLARAKVKLSRVRIGGVRQSEPLYAGIFDRPWRQLRRMAPRSVVLRALTKTRLRERKRRLFAVVTILCSENLMGVGAMSARLCCVAR